MNQFYESRKNVIEAVEHGASTIERLNGPHVGPTTFDRIDYPQVQVLPESMDQQSGNEYTNYIRLNCFFQRKRGTTYLEQLEAALDALGAALDELSTVDCVLSYFPTTIEDFAGEQDNTALLLISIRIQVGTLIDLADL